MRLYATLAGVVLSASAAHADPGRLLGDDTFAVHDGGPYILDAGLFAAQPAALPSGISTGLGAGVTRQCGCGLSYGLRASWSTESESSQTWVVTQWDMRLRGLVQLRHTAGRGILALRLGGGPTVVHEHRVRTQSERSGMTIESSSTALLPAADLEALVGLHVAGPWIAMIAVGPTVEVLDGNVRGGWIAQLTVGWQP
ncbi:MAG: hypothetical protein JO257_04815 [Deltaproteobacteria bacterium]|nr:hypothetical protein [Deltaproteobacteria bacterium]